jgi:Protein of unknown function (DUF2808)
MLKKIAVYFCLAIGLTANSYLAPQPSPAQTGSGIVLFGNVRDKALSYNLDSGRSRSTDRYYLEIPAQKSQVSQFVITYPEHFDGEFDTERMDVRVSDKNVPLESAKWDKNSRRVEVTVKDAIPAGKNITLVLSNVRNPYYGGLYQLDARVIGPSDLPILRYVGSWVIGFE